MPPLKEAQLITFDKTSKSGDVITYVKLIYIFQIMINTSISYM
jgi:hypothetical protein